MDMDYVFPDTRPHRSFVVFNGSEPLSDEAIEGADLMRVKATRGSLCASETWSCACEWFFVIGTDGILLLNVHSSDGWFCRRKTSRFIELFLEAPDYKRPARRRKGQLKLF